MNACSFVYCCPIHSYSVRGGGGSVERKHYHHVLHLYIRRSEYAVSTTPMYKYDTGRCQKNTHKRIWHRCSRPNIRAVDAFRVSRYVDCVDVQMTGRGRRRNRPTRHQLRTHINNTNEQQTLTTSHTTLNCSKLIYTLYRIISYVRYHTFSQFMRHIDNTTHTLLNLARSVAAPPLTSTPLHIANPHVWTCVWLM